MILFGDPIINWGDILKIVIAALIGGSGIVIVYGFLLLGLKYAGVGDTAGTANTSRTVGYAIATICAILVVGVIVVGIYAITQKPS